MGLRRISTLVKKEFPKTTTYIYDIGGISTESFLKNWIVSRQPEKEETHINEKLVEELAESDVLGLSCVSLYAEQAKQLISLVKEKNPETFIVWGGPHATVMPEDAIKYSDSVCIGEGENSFMALLKKLRKREDFSNSKGFWVRKNGKVQRNELMSLMTNEELGQMPFQDFGFDIKYVTHDSIRFMTKDIYISRAGSSYTTVWALGCPHSCSYCSNDKFLANSKEYGRLRHADAEFITEELLEIKKKHDYVTHVILHDDNLSVVKKEDLENFADLWRKKVGLPIFIPGFHPSTVDKEKVEILVKAGMKKVRMGIQSGSERTLEFYGRKTSRQRILKSAEILSSFYPTINPPNFDIIVDNPLETNEDKEATLSLLRELKRPFMLYVFSLRSLPGTRLWEFAQEHPEYDFKGYSYNDKYVFDRWMGMMVFVLSLYNPSKFMYRVWDALARNKRINRILFPFVRIVYLAKFLYYDIRLSNLESIAKVSPSLAKVLVSIFNRFSRKS
ncbi:B12-binding domain-containing radical SAM protein [Candidatus Latescibacterota bacterium]